MQCDASEGSGAGPVMPLSMLGCGNRGRIADLTGGPGMNRRLCELGLVPGEMVTIVPGGMGGQMVVLAGNTRLGIGRGMAHRIMVRPL